MGDQEDYDEAFLESEAGDEYDRMVPAHITDKEYRKKLRPDARLQYREARVASPSKLGTKRADEVDDSDEATDSQVEPAMEQDGILMGVDESLRLAPASELVDAQQKTKVNRYQRQIKNAIRTRNPLTIDEETGGVITDPIIDVNAHAYSSDETGFWGGAELTPEASDIGNENAVIDEWEWYQYSGFSQAIQVPLKAPRRGEINYFYLVFAYNAFGAPNYIVYLLDKHIAISTKLSNSAAITLSNDRRHIIYQYGDASNPVTDRELKDSVDPPARYVNRDPDPKKEYRIWLRIESVGNMAADEFFLGLNIRRLG